MTGSSIGMQEQDRSEREKFENELKAILKAGNDAGVLMRVIGSLAFQMHCQQFGYLQQAMGRAYTDIDFAAYNNQVNQIQKLLQSMGYVENREVFISTEGERAIFDKPGSGLHIDIFYEKLDFCHTIYWKDRLEVDSPTIPLAELLLEKMQIVQINEKDVIDTIMLLLEHPLGDEDRETINIKRTSGDCLIAVGDTRLASVLFSNVEHIGPVDSNNFSLRVITCERNSKNTVTSGNIQDSQLSIGLLINEFRHQLGWHDHHGRHCPSELHPDGMLRCDRTFF